MKTAKVTIVAIVVGIIGLLVATALQNVPKQASAPAHSYGQSATGGYGQPVSGGYGQPTAGGYGQPATGGYGQPTTGGYGQPTDTNTAVTAAGVSPLVSTSWVAERLDTITDPGQTKIRLVDVSKGGYGEGHIPGAVHNKWGSEIFASETDHMVMGLPEMERVLRKFGITTDTHIVLYDGDGKTHHLTRAYWTLKYWNLKNLSIMDGGKALWQKQGRKLTKAVPNIKQRAIEVKYPPNTKIRAMYAPHIISALATGNALIVDSRYKGFYSGEIYSLDKWVRNGHITGALNVTTMDGMTKDKTFKPVEELRKMYLDKGITPDKAVIVYCDTGVLAAHAWFVLSELLGYKNVMVYDGSMREYANMFDTPMEPGIVGGNFPKTPIKKLQDKVK